MENTDLMNVKSDNILFKVFIKKIPPDLNEQKLLQILSPFGDPFKVFIHELKWGLIYFGSYEDAKNSIRGLNSSPPYYLEVRFANSPTHEMTLNEMTEMQEKLAKEAERLHIKETQILLKLKRLEYQMLLVKLNEDKRLSNVNLSDNLRNEENCDLTSSFDQSFDCINTFMNDISGDIEPNDYGNSNYRNICETYMSSWIDRFLKNSSYKTTSKLQESNSENQMNHNEMKSTSQDNEVQTSYQHSQNVQLKHHMQNFKQKNYKKGELFNKNSKQNKHIQPKPDSDCIPVQTSFPQKTLPLKKSEQCVTNINNSKKNYNDEFPTNSECIGDENYKLPMVTTTEPVLILSEADQKQLKMLTVSKENGCNYIKLPKDVFTEVKVEWIETDLEGWVSLISNENIMDKIVLALNDNHDSLISKPKVGLLCAANFKNELWCRAVMLSTFPDITVHYIDYGNTEKVKISDLRELQAEFKNIPGLVVHIRLADGSVDKLSDGKKLSLTPVAKEGNFTICHVQDGFYPVEELKHIENEKIFCSSPKDPTTVEERSIIQLLRLGYTGILTLRSEIKNQEYIAIIIPSEFTETLSTLKSLAGNNFEITEENFFSKEGDLVLVQKGSMWMRGYILSHKSNESSWVVALVDDGVVQNVTETKKILPQHASLPEFACHLFVTKLLITQNEFQMVFKPGAHFQFEVLDVKKNSVTCMLTSSDIEKPICKIEVTSWNYISLIKQVNLPPTFKLNTISVVSESIVRIILPQSQQRLLIQNKDATKALKSLLIKMKSLCDDFKPLLRSPVIGEILASRFSEDQLWYRVQIKKLISNNTCALVQFLDYGNEESVSIKDLRILPQILLDIPCCLIPVKLKGLPNNPLNMAQKTEINNYIINSSNFIIKCDIFEEEITLYTENNTNFNNLIMELGKCSKNSSVASNFEQLEISNEIKLKGIKVTIEQNEDLSKSVKNIASISVEDLHIDSMKWSLGEAEVLFIDFFVISCGMVVCMLHDEQVLESVQKMDEQIAKSVELKNPECFIPEEGDTCLAKYKGVWYRALCLSKTEDDVLVLYVDYGNTETIPYTDVGKITEDLVQQPSVAMICSLFDDNLELSEKQKEILKHELEKNHVYDCEIISEIGPGQYKIKFPHIEKLL